MLESITELYNQIMASDPSVISILFGALIGPIVFYQSKKVIKYFRFKKRNNNVTIEYLPPEILEKIDEFDESKLQEEFKDEIIRFYNILKDNLPEIALINFHNNINSLIIEVNQKLNPGSGLYYYDDNKIEINKEKEASVLTHELLHMSTRKKGRSGGLDQVIKYENNSSEYTASCINEGYTELLNRRYFHPLSETSVNYDYMVLICESIEKIVGKDLMELSYFTLDLDSIVDELCMYTSIENVNQLILDCEYIFVLFSEDNDNLDALNYKRYNKKKMNNINDILIDIYINKLKQENNYTKEALEEFIHLLPGIVTYGDDVYKLKTDNIIKAVEEENGKLL